MGESGISVGMISLSDGVLLVFPFHGPTPPLLLVEQRHLCTSPFFDCLSMRHWNGSFAFSSSRRRLCLSHVHLQLISFRVTSWHFVLTWLLSLGLIRRGVMRRSCVHELRLCWCGCVRCRLGKVMSVQGGKAGAALVCTAPLRPTVCKTPCVSLCSPLCFAFLRGIQMPW